MTLGDALPVDAYPIDTDEKKKIAADWRARSGSTEAAAEKLLAVVAAAKDQEEWKGMSWGAYGLCWGGKVRVHPREPTLIASFYLTESF